MSTLTNLNHPLYEEIANCFLYGGLKKASKIIYVRLAACTKNAEKLYDENINPYCRYCKKKAPSGLLHPMEVTGVVVDKVDNKSVPDYPEKSYMCENCFNERLMTLTTDQIKNYLLLGDFTFSRYVRNRMIRLLKKRMEDGTEQ